MSLILMLLLLLPLSIRPNIFSSFSLTLELAAILVKVCTRTKPKKGWYCEHGCSMMIWHETHTHCSFLFSPVFTLKVATVQEE